MVFWASKPCQPCTAQFGTPVSRMPLRRASSLWPLQRQAKRPPKALMHELPAVWHLDMYIKGC